eukprot:TRINITY_DN1973_c0_g1_i3.p1 TRINITY_DN1973_c0_g1~~TRINITY_DN1973_c0_g1_i3.p1  ORF type:complete len:419 (+),score=84.73 TRINITY_DN1973_c0_g1_i3:1133-2389(+)
MLLEQMAQLACGFPSAWNGGRVMAVWNMRWWKKDGEMSVAEVGLERGDGVSRRDFLRVGGLSVVGLSQSAMVRAAAAFAHRRAILIVMTGGASQLETFDPKPDASSSIRGPFKSIETAVAGVRFSETLPMLAQRANRLAVIRTMNHDAAPIHETGQQLLQTGRLSMGGVKFPHWGSVVASQSATRLGVPSNAIVPAFLSSTGVNAYRGQEAGLLGSEWEPVAISSAIEGEPESIRRQYGETDFGRLLLRSRQLVERGTRCVTVNLFDSLHQRATWDCHGDPNCGPATLNDYQSKFCPDFDRALSGLLDDLAQRGLLDDTLVVATGEFGRTPHVNERVGRDHWTDCWSAVVAGGRVAGGKVIGASDATASRPVDRPVSPGELTATLLDWCGANVESLSVTVDKEDLPLVPCQKLSELWS